MGFQGDNDNVNDGLSGFRGGYVAGEKIEVIKLNSIPLYDLGNSIQIAGMVLQGKGKTYSIMFPDTKVQSPNIVVVNYDEWKTLLYQLDTLGTLLFPGTPGAKVVVRKSQRKIEQSTNWKVFHRDGYRCRYCGATGETRPLSVDHLVLWEDMGQTVEENLITACTKCNVTRNNTRYLDWLESKYYLSRVPSPEIHKLNEDAWATARDLPLRESKRSR